MSSVVDVNLILLLIEKSIRFRRQKLIHRKLQVANRVHEIVLFKKRPCTNIMLSVNDITIQYLNNKKNTNYHAFVHPLNIPGDSIVPPEPFLNYIRPWK